MPQLAAALHVLTGARSGGRSFLTQKAAHVGSDLFRGIEPGHVPTAVDEVQVASWQHRNGPLPDVGAADRVRGSVHVQCRTLEAAELRGVEGDARLPGTAAHDAGADHVPLVSHRVGLSPQRHAPVHELVWNASGIEAWPVPVLTEDRSNSRRLVGKTNHERSEGRGQQPNDLRNGYFGHEWRTTQQDDPVDARRVLCRQPERPDVADRSSEYVRARESERIQDSPQDVYGQTLGLVIREIDR